MCTIYGNAWREPVKEGDVRAVQIPVKFYDVATHGWTREIVETWVHSTYFCVNCGCRTLWHNGSRPDAFVGREHICLTCAKGYYLKYGMRDLRDVSSDPISSQRLTALLQAAKEQG